ncbi:MAG TPA: response regulator [Candidatus Paceibacterota bacterium]|nr:response regulator [Candidatus Paceibacterota bacterium]
MQPTYRILIVDDNEAAAAGLAQLLEFRGHTLKLAHQGEGVENLARDFNPEVIILDIGLPDINGYEVASKLRSELSYHPLIIALTGYGQYEDRERAREAGFDHHLTKPVGLRDIETVLTTRQMAET